MIRSSVFSLVFFGVIMAAAPVGAGTMYVTNDSNNFFYRIDVTTGVTTLVGPSGILLGFTGLAFDTSTETMYVSNAYDPPVLGLGIADLATGAVTVIGSHVNSNNVHGLAYDSVHDVLYGADTMPCGGLSIVNRSTGESTCIGPFVVTSAIYGLAFDENSDTLFGVDGDSLYTIDRATGAATAVGAHFMLGPSDLIGLEFDLESGILYGARADRLYSLDPTTGASTLIANGIGNPNPSGLASVPSNPVFSDGFETGDLRHWSHQAP